MMRHFLILSIMFACIEAGGRAHAQDATASYVAATVLDKKIYLKPSSPAVVAKNRANLSPEKFAKWESESRWRPLVSRISHHVMSDWASKNNVKPTREEIQKQFANEARQHLQAYANPEGEKRVALAIGWATGSAVEWARAKALYEKYGGSIAVSSFGGWVSIEGRNALLKEYAAAGKIKFNDPKIEEEFWSGVESPAVLDATVRDPKRIANHFAQAPWQGWGIRTANVFESQDKK